VYGIYAACKKGFAEAPYAAVWPKAAPAGNPPFAPFFNGVASRSLDCCEGRSCIGFAVTNTKVLATLHTDRHDHMTCASLRKHQPSFTALKIVTITELGTAAGLGPRCP
jgi:hypothetical protein